ncbi:hypothetical protein AKG34_13435 [Peribacillus butanolivorans]|uniref:hypothetical protein n=1 Tax=Peribacillus butanolivorans TaxID=421767 RepID=UPI0006A6BCE3|nr:hypothetical protein [Peribacillus butanolivorans]KON69649.1 hypothetical protein AKG34_13435 [Peribacillus butanolivorans]
MAEERTYKVSAIIDNGSYQDEVREDVVNLMMKADIVTIRGTSVRVKEKEVNEIGEVKFHGNRAELF